MGVDRACCGQHALLRPRPRRCDRAVPGGHDDRASDWSKSDAQSALTEEQLAALVTMNVGMA